jgi:hypothetical protein
MPHFQKFATMRDFILPSVSAYVPQFHYSQKASVCIALTF